MVIGDHLRRLAAQISAWQGIVDVHQDSIFWDEPQLPADSRRWKFFETQFWFDVVPLERRARLLLVVFVQWHQPKVGIIAKDAIMSNFISISE